MPRVRACVPEKGRDPNSPSRFAGPSNYYLTSISPSVGNVRRRRRCRRGRCGRRARRGRCGRRGLSSVGAGGARRGPWGSWRAWAASVLCNSRGAPVGSFAASMGFYGELYGPVGDKGATEVPKPSSHTARLP